jgi:hypothetical protein
MKRSIIAAFATFTLLGLPLLASAAQIYLDPATGKYPPGVTFGVDIRLDNQNQCINAAEIDLSYPQSQIEAVAASNGGSIFSLWVKSPTIYGNYGLVSLTGGLPGGYCGRVPGDPALSNKIATVYFRFPTSTVSGSSTLPQSATLSFLSGTRAVLNDGQGTVASLTVSGATYTTLLKGVYAPIDTWQEAIANDTTPPDSFVVAVYRDPSLFSNQWFAVFSAVDKQTGIDHYEIAEVSAADGNLPENRWNWIRAVSPYLIKNQGMNDLIAVRAIDAAGNERVERYTPPQTAPAKSKIAMWSYLAIIGFVGVALVHFILRLL